MNHTLVCVVKQSVHEDSMAWHVAETVRDISVTADSTTSYGGHSRQHKFQQPKNRQVWAEMTASVQMVSNCYPGQKANHWQSRTPMPTPTSLTGRQQQGRQLTRRLVTRRQSTGGWPVATSLCQLLLRQLAHGAKRQYNWFRKWVGTNLIHDFTAVTFSVKLAFFREKRQFPWTPWFFVQFSAFSLIYYNSRVLSAAFVRMLLFATCRTSALSSWHWLSWVLT